MREPARALLRLGALGIVLALSFAATPAFNRAPWLADLGQVRQAFATKYSDLEWAVFDRELDLPALFAEAQARIEAASNDADARAAFDRLARRIYDGHVQFRWPAAPAAASNGATDRCAALGFDAEIFGAPLAALAAGYSAIPSPQEFPSGLIAVNGRTVGVIKIGLFSPQGTPALCRDALAALKIDPARPCDDACSDRVDAWTSAQMTRDFKQALRALDARGAQALVVDIAGNGGGSEWAEAAMRMLTAKRLKSEPMGFVRGTHWADAFARNAKDLRDAAKTAAPDDRKMLLALADAADAKRKVALQPCNSAPIWRGRHPVCSWLGKGFFGSGLLASADAAQLKGKPWAPLVFSAAEYPYEDGVWRKPVIVLIDAATGSASSEFVAVLQDNRAAVIMGAPATGGCGHTNGGTPTTLSNSKGVLELPDCVRFRADGTNEADGIEPDILVGFSPGDGPHRTAARFLARLPDALSLAMSRS